MHWIWEEVAEVTAQSFPSTVTVLFFGLAEKSFPVMVRYWPPIFPFVGDTAETEGRAVNSKYSLGSKDERRMYLLLLAFPGVTNSVMLYFPASC